MPTVYAHVIMSTASLALTTLLSVYLLDVHSKVQFWFVDKLVCAHLLQ